MVDFLLANFLVIFAQENKLKEMSPKLHHMLHTDVHKQQRNLSPRAHSGAISCNILP